MNTYKYILDIDDKKLQMRDLSVRPVTVDIELPEGRINVKSVLTRAFRYFGNGNTFYVDLYTLEIGGKVYEDVWIYTERSEEADEARLIVEYNKQFIEENEDLKEEEMFDEFLKELRDLIDNYLNS